jgi:hypothetical protein
VANQRRRDPSAVNAQTKNRAQSYRTSTRRTEIADWLEKLGLGQYAQRFAENGIDFSVLGYLTDQGLEKIGVLLGHRRKMLAAVGELAGLALIRNLSPSQGVGDLVG